MVPLSRLGRQIIEVTAALRTAGARYALIGGLALAPYHVIRATQDVDLLVDLETADGIEAQLLKLGYHCLHRDDDAANYVRGGERVDLLYARRPIARRLLEGAAELSTSLGSLRVISPEGLIALQPLAGAGGSRVPPTPESDPFRVLDDLMSVVEALCPTWPQRGPFVSTRAMLL